MHNFTYRQMFAFLVLCFLTCTTANSQEESVRPVEDFVYQKNTALVFSVDPKTNGITEVFLKDTDIENQLYKLKEDCYRCEFYLGSVEGNLKLRGRKIINSKSSVFTINTSRNLMPGTHYSPGIKYAPGSEFNLAGIKTTVVANRKGTFILKAK